MSLHLTKVPQVGTSFPHARKYGNLLFLSGVAPLSPGRQGVVGGACAYEQTKAVIANIRATLEGCGVSFKDMVDCQCFLVNMARDFPGFNKAYKEFMAGASPTRTTVAVRGLTLQGQLVEFKVIARAPNSTITPVVVRAKNAPLPVGAYPHAVRYGDLIFVSGMGPRDPTNSTTVPGGPITNPDYDVAAQTTATINNIRRVLESCGARFEDIIDCNCFLIDMKRDFKKFNEAYRQGFEGVAATRTTFSIRNLPTPIAVEMKCIVRAPDSPIQIQNAQVVRASRAPSPVGAYPHARRFGGFLFISGMGPRDPKTNAVPGGPIVHADGSPNNYDVAKQTQATLDNIKTVLDSCGASLDDVVDIQCYLINMDRDFNDYDAVYKKNFTRSMPARTTLAIRNLPTPIAVEMKCIARAPPLHKM